VAIFQTLNVVEDLLDQSLLFLLFGKGLHWLLNATGGDIKHVEVLTKLEERLLPLVLAEVFHKLGELRQNLRVSGVNFDLKLNREKYSLLINLRWKPDDFGVLIHLVTLLLDFLDLADKVLVRVMSVLELEGKLCILVLEVNDAMSILFALLEQGVHKEHIVRDLSLDLGNSHEIVSLLVLSVVESEDHLPNLVYKHEC
jgi:hypothetical protein